MAVGRKSRGPGALKRLVLRAALGIAALLLAYVAAAVAGSLLPRNRGWSEPADGIELFVRSNGIHVDLVLPADAAGTDLYSLVPPRHVRQPQQAEGWVAFGWGQRDFYLETPRWSDLTLTNAMRSVFGGRALMHVEHLGRPRPAADMRPLRLDERAYRRLVSTVAAAFATDSRGRQIPLRGSGYGEGDVFYEAVGRYHAFNTSNQWTADALAEAGVKVGVWTPFAQGVLWRIRRPAAAQ